MSLTLNSPSGRFVAVVTERPDGSVVDTYRVHVSTHPDDKRSGAVRVHTTLHLISSVVHVEPFHVALDRAHDQVWARR